jgi:hypothetical protein
MERTMPAVAIPNTYRVVSTHSFTGETMVNVSHVRKDAGGTTEMNAVVNHFHDFWVGTAGSSPKGISDQLQLKCVLTSISIQDISTLPFGVPTVHGYSVAGSNGGVELPLNTALVISLRTATAGRSYRGRFYLGGLTSSWNTTDGAYPRPDSTRTSNTGIAFHDLCLALIADGTPLVVASRELATSQEVTGIRIDNVFDTQRRRAKQQPRSLLYSADF